MLVLAGARMLTEEALAALLVAAAGLDRSSRYCMELVALTL